MKSIAVLLTVYNRKETTIKSLYSLYEAMREVDSLRFDIYMTNDGCSDGTEIEVHKIFPNINIINGDGTLFWGGGMNVSWQTAKSTKKYDYYIWFNDDAVLFKNAIKILFETTCLINDIGIVTGAFMDEKGEVSYGGRTSKNYLIKPNGNPQEVFFMNGNLVLIPNEIVEKIGIIDSIFKHSLGDWDYGCRAVKAGFKVVLSTNFVGNTNRHDKDLTMYANGKISIGKRFSYLYSIKNSPIICFRFDLRHLGLFTAIKKFLLFNLYALFPVVFKLRNRFKILL